METKIYNFSTIKYSDLEQIVEIRLQENDYKFDEWFEYAYPLSDFEHNFLENLIKKNRKRLPSYSEEKLKMRFLSLILNQVDFTTDTFQEWYEASLSGFINGIELKGFTDFMVATGEKEPRKPYFFIQEFKPQQADKDVEDQLLAEMLVAIEKNETNIFRGAYIIGQNWRFVILEKIAQKQFEYFVSKQFDALDLPDLKQIYINLQAVKYMYCKD